MFHLHVHNPTPSTGNSGCRFKEVVNKLAEKGKVGMAATAASAPAAKPKVVAKQKTAQF